MTFLNMVCAASREGGRVVAIVRGSSDEKATERLRAGFDSGDAKLLQRYDALSKHLVVYAGAPSATEPLHIFTNSMSLDSYCIEVAGFSHNNRYLEYSQRCCLDALWFMVSNIESWVR